MKIEHIAVWVQDLEKMKAFYEKYFGAKSGDKYHNPNKDFTSYFLSFEGGSRLELMHNPQIIIQNNDRNSILGLTHLAFSVESREAVDLLTERLRTDGYEVVGEARTTGDGYYESVILDPENNRIEVTE